jgi:hypothetical protein
MMVRKDFDTVAKIIHGEKPSFYPYMEEMEAIRMNAKEDLWEYLRDMFIYEYRDHKNFDEVRFKEVCANGLHA